VSLVLQAVRARVAGIPVLQGVDITLRAGGVVALLGRNGAGKTTTLRTVLGLAQLDGGSVSCEGADLSRMPTWRRARQGIFYVPEDGGVFQDLTVLENLRLSARMQPERVLEAFPELGPLLSRRSALLSGGERKILALARAFASESPWLLIDEPSLGLAPGVLRRLVTAVAALREHAAILLVEQNLGFAQAVADEFVLLHQGRSVDHGPIAQLRDSPFFGTAMHFGSGQGVS
jgi:branched-chain amino acid transport system ATP-binding protein